MKKIFIVILALGVTTANVQAEEWWILNYRDNKCDLSPYSPKKIMKSTDGCKTNKSVNNEILMLDCKKDLGTTFIFTTNLAACMKTLKNLNKK